MAESTGNTRRFAINTFYSVLSWLSPLVLALVTTPFLIKGLGVEMYGVYVLVLGFITYFFTYGVGKSAAKFVAEYRAKNDEEMVRKVVSAALIANIVISIIAAGIIAIAANFIVGSILDLNAPLDHVAEIGLLLACVTVVVSVPGQVFQFVLQGIHRFDRFLFVVNLNAVLLSVGNIAIAVYMPSVTLLFVWNLLITAGTSIASFVVAKRQMPELRFDPKIGGEPLRSVLRYMLSIIGYQIFGNGLLLFERSWLMRNFGAESVSHYVVAMNLAMYIHIFSGSLVLALFPLLNEMLDDRSRMRRIYEIATKVILCVAVFFGLSAIAIGRTFLTIWLGPEFAEVAHMVLIIHVVTFSFLALATIVWQIAESFRAAALNSFATLLWTLISIPSMIVFANSMGFQGVALGRTVGVVSFLFLIIWVERRYIESNEKWFWPPTILKVAIAGAVAFAVESFIISQLSESWLSVIVAFGTGFGVFAITILVGRMFDVDERQMFLRATGLR